jgi:GNAT superfamily N-acetyltransferase
MSETVTIESVSLQPLEAIGWFMQLDELRPVGPGETHEVTMWAVRRTDGRLDTAPADFGDQLASIVTLALVDTNRETTTIHRIGTLAPHRGEGHATALIDRLATEYGVLELECRESLAANEYYAATGWEETDVAFGDPENLVQWRYTP